MSEQGSEHLCPACGTYHAANDICPARDGDDREIIAEIKAEMAANQLIYDTATRFIVGGVHCHSCNALIPSCDIDEDRVWPICAACKEKSRISADPYLEIRRLQTLVNELRRANKKGGG